ncbi:MAG: YcxB family protein [Clostridia bacterium]|nr:YcxB family protein [Clostridia bacterium]MBR6810675.1 YcxB family protein [Clostridia bacterium]
MCEQHEAPRFSGQFHHTKENLTEMVYPAQPMHTKIMFPALGVLCLAFSVYNFLRGHLNSTFYVIAVFYVLLSVYSFLRLPLYARKYANQSLKKMEELDQAHAVSTIELHEKELVTSSNISEDVKKTTYDHIIRYQETKHLILLWRPQKLFYPIEKNSLTGGTADQLKTFLKEKNPDIRMR